MKVRLRDWASLNCITERTVQVHIKENEKELAGHIERKGKQGTWLDEFAQDFLIERIQLPNRKEVYQPTARENALMIQMNELSLQLAEAEKRVAENAEIVGRVKYLEAAHADMQQERDRLIGEKAVAEANAAYEASRATMMVEENGELRDELNKLTERNELTEGNLKKAQARYQELQQTWEEYWSLPLIKRIFAKKPEIPGENKE